MAQEFFAGSDPNEQLKKEEERLMRSMNASKLGGAKPRVVVPSQPAAAPPTSTIVHQPPAQVPHPAVSPRSFQVSPASQSLFARAAANADTPAPAPAPARPTAAASTSTTTSNSSVDTQSTGAVFAEGDSADEMARREEDRMRRQFSGASIGSGAAAKSSHAPAAAPPPSATKLPEPYVPAISATATPATSQPSAPSVGGPFELELLAELNRARQQPHAFVELLREYARNVDGSMLRLPGSVYQVQLREGAAVLQDAIQTLERCSARGPLQLNMTFSKSALDLVRDHGPRGSTTDEIAAAAGTAVRLSRYGAWKKKVIETTAYVPVPARDVVALWLIDDGTAGRLNRTSVLDAGYAVVGIASGPHSKYGRMICVDFTEGFVDGAPPPPRHVTQDSEYERVTSAPRHSLLSELPDGSGFVIDAGAAPTVPKTGCSVALRNGTEIVLRRNDGTNVQTLKYELPFAFPAHCVAAQHHSGDGRVLITLKKPAAVAPVAGEVTLARYVQGAGNPEYRRMHIDIKETKDKVLLCTVPSEFAEEITVKLRDGKVMLWECKHFEDDPAVAGGKAAISSTQTMQLPFEVSPAACSVTLHGNNGAEGATTEILKPGSGAGANASNGTEVIVPLQ